MNTTTSRTRGIDYAAHQSYRQRLVALYRFRELVYNLVQRELKARYKNSVLGFVWSLLNPLGMMVVFTIVRCV